MANIAFIVDGFNLYHSLCKASHTLSLGGSGTKWLNLDSLFHSYRANIGTGLGNKAGTASLQLHSHSIDYFSALATHMDTVDTGTTSRHQSYLDCLASTGVNVQMGRFKRKDIRCDHCKIKFNRYEEKETDVAIALRIVELAAGGHFDVLALVSGDTDIAPALRSARLLNSQIKLVCLFPFERKNKELANLADFSLTMGATNYANHQFSDPFTLVNGSQRPRPRNW